MGSQLFAVAAAAFVATQLPTSHAQQSEFAVASVRDEIRRLSAAKNAPSSRLAHHHESIVKGWLESVSNIDLHGNTAADLASKIISAGGWACYSTLVQLQIHTKESRRKKEDEGDPHRLFGIPPTVLDEIKKMCGATEGGLLPLRSKGGAGGAPGAPSINHNTNNWVFNRQVFPTMNNAC